MLRHLLIANRGEIALRILRTARAMGLGTSVVFADGEGDTPWVRMADAAVNLGSGPLAATYLDVGKVIAAAEAVGADAIHPGYGFLSENADLADACGRAAIVFVGPPADSIRMMAHKAQAKALVAAAGVPTLPSADLGATLDVSEGQAAAVGFPLLVKASAGGGGRGMRRVDGPAQLVDAVAAARREAASSFGSAEVFLERLLLSPRHIEVQVFGDTHGRVVHLYDRECSIQRRHQKVVEEAPATNISAELRSRMWSAAVAAAQAVHYVGAGTVEFLVEGDGFYFLEMNTRLQVEHPVTEAITGLDLVRLQLEVAGGRPLVVHQDDITVSGHAIEARLCAEQPRRDYLPSSGVIRHLAWPAGPGVRVDAGIEAGSVVTTNYDSMLAKVIAHGADRGEAAARLRRAVASDLQVDGVETNQDLLAAIFRHPGFLSGDTPTDFLDRHPQVVAAGPSPAELRLRAVAAVIGRRHVPGAVAALVPTVPAGWRNFPSQSERVELVVEDDAFVVEVVPLDADHMTVRVNEEAHVVGLPAPGAPPAALEIDGIRRPVEVRATGERIWVGTPSGSTTFVVSPRLPRRQAEVTAGACAAPLPGLIVAVLVEPGSAVEADQALVVLEAMKVEHTLRAAGPGVVTAVSVRVGDRVDAMAVLVVLDPSDGARPAVGAAESQPEREEHHAVDR